MFNTNVKPVLLRGSESQRVNEVALHKLQTFNGCLSRIVHIRWPGKLSTEDLWRTADQEPVTSHILRRNWSWTGHTLMKSVSNITRQVVVRNPHGEGKAGKTQWQHPGRRNGNTREDAMATPGKTHWQHPQEVCQQHHQTGCGLESTREGKKGKAQERH